MDEKPNLEPRKSSGLPATHIYNARSLADRPKVFELVHIAIVNWYLLDREDLPVRGAIAITGANGAGKSSIQDGILAVISALDESKMDFNALARGGASKALGGRSVKDYALGKLDDYGYRRSDEAGTLTRFSLGFKHTVTQEEVSIGFAISTAPGQDKYDIEALFIVKGRVLKTDDFVDDFDEDEYSPVFFQETTDRLQTEGLQVETYSKHEKRKFLKHYLTALQGQKFRMDAEPERVRKGFLAAASLKEIKNISDFARRYVFDPAYIDVGDFRESYERYTALKNKVVRIQDEIDVLSGLIDVCTSYETKGRQIEACEWFKRRALNIEEYLRFRGTRENMIKAEADYREREVLLQHGQNALEQRLAQRNAMEKRLNEAGVNDMVEKLRLQDEQKIRAAGELRGEIQRFDTAIKGVVGLQQNAHYIKNHRPLFEAINAVAKTLSPLPASAVEADAVDHNLEGVRSFSALETDIKAQLQKAFAEADAAEMQLKEFEALKNTQGRSSVRVPEAISTFQESLRRDGFDTKLLFELVDDVDEEWQDVIEAYLGQDRLAIVPLPDQAIGAIDAYRRHPNTSPFRAVKVLNSAWAVAKGRRAKPNSIASKITASDPTIRAILDDRYGDIICIEDSEDFKRHARVLTRDFTTQSGGMVSRIRPADGALLSSTTSPQMAARLQESFYEAQSQLKKATQEVTRIETDHAAAKRFITAHDRWQERRIRKICEEIDDIANGRASIQKQIEVAFASVDADLQTEFQALEQDIREAQKELQDDEARYEKAKELFNKQKAILGILPELRSYRTRLELNKRPTAADFAMTSFSALFKRNLEQKQARSSQALSIAARIKSLETALAGTATVCDQEKQRLEPEIEAAGARIVKDYANYVRDFQQDPILDFETRRADIHDHVSRRHAKLEDHVLLDYEAKLAEALVQVDEMLQGRYLTELHGRIQEIDIRRNSINNSLRKSPFHGEHYRFVMKCKADYLPLTKLADRVGGDGAQLSLSVDPDDIKDLEEDDVEALEKLKLLISSPEFEYDEFTDPLAFYDFELEIGRYEQSETGRTVFRKKTTFTHGVGTRSGGEIQAPYYVVLASAMSSLYHGRSINTHDSLGMGLICLDEVMNKTDSPNMRRFIDFLVSIGLQPIMAAPGKERSTFQSRCDTVIDIVKIENNAMLDVLYPKDRLHAEIKASDPNERPLEAFARDDD